MLCLWHFVTGSSWFGAGWGVSAARVSEQRVLIIKDYGASVIVGTTRLPHPNRAVLNKAFFVGPNKGKTGRTITVTHLNNSIAFVYGAKDSVFNRRSRRLFRRRKVGASCIFSSSKGPSNMTLVAISRGTRGYVIITSKTGTGLLPSSLTGTRRTVRLTSLVLVRLRIPVRAIYFITSVT